MVSDIIRKRINAGTGRLWQEEIDARMTYVIRLMRDKDKSLSQEAAVTLACDLREHPLSKRLTPKN